MGYTLLDCSYVETTKGLFNATFITKPPGYELGGGMRSGKKPFSPNSVRNGLNGLTPGTHSGCPNKIRDCASVQLFKYGLTQQ